MGTLVQIRDVPASVHGTLKARAALTGRSLSEYLRSELERIAERPTPAELRERLAERSPVPGESGAETIRAVR
jgi:plasmid stability protein